MTIRAGSMGHLIFERSRRGSLRRVLIALLIIAALLLYVEEGEDHAAWYQIEALEREKRDLERANRSLGSKHRA
jgi:hypothetical protein